MPEYDFYCKRCRRPFSAFMSMREHDAHAATCPTCRRDDQVERRLAAVHVVTSRKS